MRENSSRRKFVKQAAMAAAAVGALTATAGKKTVARPQSENGCVLYRETAEWKKYYETLK